MARKYDGSASLVLTESEKNKILARARRMGSKVYAKVCFNLEQGLPLGKVIKHQGANDWLKRTNQEAKIKPSKFSASPTMVRFLGWDDTSILTKLYVGGMS
ncbi:MAG: hypothetical protein KGJ07_00580 [Patescibacteria group bacterium]|nr:hypothetical protein [Patescibacteria group bacterium]